MILPPLSLGTAQPRAVPLLPLVAKISPRASKSFAHVAGHAAGGLVTLDDLNACTWFSGGGRELRGKRAAFGVAGLKGLEDHDRRKQ